MMYDQRVLGIALLIGCGWVAMPTIVNAGSDHCSKTASHAAKACRAEAHDDYWIAQGNCRNVAGRNLRAGCYELAEATLDEDRELCDDQRDARLDLCAAIGEARYDPSFPPADYVDPDDIGNTVAANPYLSLVPGQTNVLVAGEAGDELVIEYVTAEVEDIEGVPCRVVKVVELDVVDEGGPLEYELNELTDDLYAQHLDGDIWYCGEIARNYEDGRLSNLDGTFIHGFEFARAGVIMRAAPVIGEVYRQEFALGEAEDVGEVLDTAGVPAQEVPGFECAPGGCLVTLDTNPQDPESTENKYFKAGVGFVLAVAFEDGVATGDREELTCTGGTFASCVTDPDLIDALCDADVATFGDFCP